MDDDLLICPFNTSHLIHRSRMLNHAVKCGKTHKGSTRVCPFDPAHEVTDSEYRSHLLMCAKINQPIKPTDNSFGKLLPAQSSTKGKTKKRNKKNKNSIPPKDPQNQTDKEDDSSCLSTKNILKEKNPVHVTEKTSLEEADGNLPLELDSAEESKIVVMGKESRKASTKDNDKSCLSVKDVVDEGNSVSILEKLEEADCNLPSKLDPAEDSWTVVVGKKESKQNKPKYNKETNTKDDENEIQCSDEACGGLSMNIAPLEENWDDCVGKVRYDPNKVSEMKPVLRAPQGKTKTERKKFRKDERLRYNLLANNLQHSAG